MTTIQSVDDPAVNDRHPGVRDTVRWFTFDHLRPGPARDTSARIATLAVDLLNTLPDSAELTVGLRKLLEAKDCLVRAAIAAQDADL